MKAGRVILNLGVFTLAFVLMVYWAINNLVSVKGIDRPTCEKLLKVKPKAIKQKLAKPYEPDSWYGDVWLVTEHDNGMVLEGSRSDLVVVRMPEHANSGYVWNFGELVDAGLAIREDGRVSEDTEGNSVWNPFRAGWRIGKGCGFTSQVAEA